MEEAIKKALGIIRQYGQTDGAHHKAWVIDQITRALCRTEYDYKALVAEYEQGGEREWDPGIAP